MEEKRGIGYTIHKLLVAGFWLRCPNCEKGAMFDGFFTMRKTCPVCGVRFEKRDGESVGGVMINTIVIELLFVVGFFGVDILTDIRPVTQLPFWIFFGILFPALFYRNSRGLWVSTTYLSGGLVKDDASNQ